MNLASMRELDHNDPAGGLGPRVTPAPTPAPAPVKRGDGFVVGPDGKLSTDLPDPTVPAVSDPPDVFGHPVWPFPHMPKQDPPSEAGEADMAIYAQMAARAGAPPVALRVGDRVRYTGRPGDASWLGPVMTVLAVDAFAASASCLGRSGTFCYHLGSEGRNWERVA